MQKNRLVAAFLSVSVLVLLPACTKQAETSPPAVADSRPTPSAPKPAAAEYPTLDNPALLAAFRLSANGNVPDYLSLDAVNFQVLENSPPAYFIKGTLTYALVSDTFKQVGRVGAEGLGWIPVLERVHQAGDKVATEFTLRLRLANANEGVSPPLPADRAALGKPRDKEWRQAVIKDSAQALEAARHADEYAAARQKLGRIKANVSYAKNLLSLVTEDTLQDGVESWTIVVSRETASLGFGEVAQAIDRKNMPGRNAQQRREMAKLLDREVIPEAKRLTDLDRDLREKVRVAERYFSEL